MNLNQYQNRSKVLHQTASEVINELRLNTIFSDIGKIIFTGSYLLDLMVWKDIDCQILLRNTDDPYLAFVKMVERLFRLKAVKNIKLINFIKRRGSAMPEGLYCGIQYSYLDEDWKIDIWYLLENDFKKSKKFIDKVSDMLTDIQRKEILYWKFRILGENNRIPHLASYYLYQAILFEGLKSENQIMQYLLKNGVPISNSMLIELQY